MTDDVTILHAERQLDSCLRRAKVAYKSDDHREYKSAIGAAKEALDSLPALECEACHMRFRVFTSYLASRGWS